MGGDRIGLQQQHLLLGNLCPALAGSGALETHPASRATPINCAGPGAEGDGGEALALARAEDDAEGYGSSSSSSSDGNVDSGLAMLPATNAKASAGADAACDLAGAAANRLAWQQLPPLAELRV